MWIRVRVPMVMVVTLLEILPHVPSKVFSQSGSHVVKFCRVLRHIVIFSMVDSFCGLLPSVVRSEGS